MLILLLQFITVHVQYACINLAFKILVDVTIETPRWLEIFLMLNFLICMDRSCNIYSVIYNCHSSTPSLNSNMLLYELLILQASS